MDYFREPPIGQWPEGSVVKSISARFEEQVSANRHRLAVSTDRPQPELWRPQ